MADKAHLTAETAAVISDVASKTQRINLLLRWDKYHRVLFIDLILLNFII